MEYLSKNSTETAEIAANFAKVLITKPGFGNQAMIFGLYGELGSGKTTFMKYLAENFGVKETIQSPTFVIEKIYNITNNEIFKKLIHIDAYRIENDQEMINLGWNEIIADPKNLICLEWPEKISKIMPAHIKIFFEHGDNENERKIKIEL